MVGDVVLPNLPLFELLAEEVPAKLKGQRDAHGTFSFGQFAMLTQGLVEALAFCERAVAG